MSLEVSFGDTVIRSVPIAGALGTEVITRFFGLTLNDWFYVSAILYTVIQAWAVIYKTIKAHKNKKEDT